jgi:WD40 repeat protein
MIRVWNASTGQLRTTLKGHTSRVIYLVFSPDGKVLSSLSSDGTMKDWDVPSGRELRTIMVKGNAQTRGQFFIGDSKTLISQEFAGALRLWDVSGLTAGESP